MKITLQVDTDSPHEIQNAIALLQNELAKHGAQQQAMPEPAPQQMTQEAMMAQQAAAQQEQQAPQQMPQPPQEAHQVPRPPQSMHTPNAQTAAELLLEADQFVEDLQNEELTQQEQYQEPQQQEDPDDDKIMVYDEEF